MHFYLRLTAFLAAGALLPSPAASEGESVDLLQVSREAGSIPPIAGSDVLALAPRGAALAQTGPVRQRLANFGDAQYVADMDLGGQRITGFLDTGSFELVVFARECFTCGAASKYDPRQSDTYKEGLLVSTQSYGSGETHSRQATDMLRLGSDTPVNQTFWKVKSATMPLLFNAAFNAIVGIGPPETPAADAWKFARSDVREVSDAVAAGRHASNESISQAMVSVDVAMEVSKRQSILQSLGAHAFSVCIGAQSGSDGYFTWNDDTFIHNPELFAKVPIVGKHTWSLKLDGMSLGRRGASNASSELVACAQSGCSALIDSGTSIIGVPSSMHERLVKETEALDFDCSNLRDLPDLVFNLGGTTFSLPPEAYVAQIQGSASSQVKNLVRIRDKERSPKCQLLAAEINSNTQYGPLYIFGLPFLRKYYTVFNIGESKKERALYVARASSNCTPARDGEGADLAVPSLQRVDLTRFYMPHRLQATLATKRRRVRI